MPCRPPRSCAPPTSTSKCLSRRHVIGPSATKKHPRVRAFVFPIFHCRHLTHGCLRNRCRDSSSSSSIAAAALVSRCPNTNNTINSRVAIVAMGSRDDTSGSSFFLSDSDYQSSFVSLDSTNNSSLAHTSSFASDTTTTTNTSFSSTSTTAATLNPAPVPYTPRTAGIRTQVDKVLTGDSLTPRGILGLASGFAKKSITATLPQQGKGGEKHKNPLLLSSPASLGITSSTHRTAALKLKVDQALNNNNNNNNDPVVVVVPPPAKLQQQGTTAPPKASLGFMGVIDKLLSFTPRNKDVASAVRSGIRRLSARKSKNNNNNTSARGDVTGNTKEKEGEEKRGASEKNINKKNKNSSSAQAANGDVFADNSSALVKVNIGGYTAIRRDNGGGTDNNNNNSKVSDNNDGDEEEEEEVRRAVKQKKDMVKRGDALVTKRVDDLTEAISRVKITDEEEATKMPAWLWALGKTMKSPKELWQQSVAEQLFEELDEEVLNGQLNHKVRVEWNALFRTTAGTCELIRKTKRRNNIVEEHRTARIKLSEKVLDDTERLYNTMAHEMCHAAAWILDDTHHPPHGEAFKAYCRKFKQYDNTLDISTCHNYEIRYKFNYQCTHCKTVFGRHATKIDTTKKNCSCGGDLILLNNNKSPREVEKKKKNKDSSTGTRV